MLIEFFHVSDFFIFMIYLKYGQILYRYSSISLTVTFIFNKIVTPKITYSYWFVINSFFISKRFLVSLITLSLIVPFSYFSLKRFLMFLIAAPFCFILKRLLASLILLSSNYLFQALDVSSLYVVKK